MKKRERKHPGGWKRTNTRVPPIRFIENEQHRRPPPPLGCIENEAGGDKEKTTSECKPKLRGNPLAELPGSKKRPERERKPSQEQEARNWKGSEGRKWREFGAEGRKKTNTESEAEEERLIGKGTKWRKGWGRG